MCTCCKTLLPLEVHIMLMSIQMLKSTLFMSLLRNYASDPRNLQEHEKNFITLNKRQSRSEF